MDFIEVLNLILVECPYLKKNEYDGIIVQKLAATNTISDTGASHQSHMAFTGKRKDIFPYLRADDYFNISYANKDDDLKKFFTLRIPLTIYQENVSYLNDENSTEITFSNSSKIVMASVLRSRRDGADDQIELSIKSLDDVDFLAFRKLLRKNDFFIILKRKKELLYDLIGLRADVNKAEELSACTDFYKLSGSQTPVDLSSFNDAEKKVNSIKIDKPHNRIIFGAPGTGKSHKLKEDCKKYFSIEKSTDIDLNIKTEIENASSDTARCFAIGYVFATNLKGKLQSELRTLYKCSSSSANAIVQGIKAKDIENSFGKFDENTTAQTIKEKIDTIKDGESQASYGIIGRIYADYLSNYTYNELKTSFNLPSGSSTAWITIGIKSLGYKINEKEISIKNYERVTFHPNYSYSQFVGTYKPVSEYGKNEISYKYVPGPFIRTYIKAVKEKMRVEESNTPPKNFLLLIEEINRANVASVFGDVFQLLDRYGEKGDSEGNHAFESEYPVTVSEDLKNYLHEEGIDTDTIAIPSNMYIWATMNSADQGVMPMDAAFKRRWDFEYLDIDEGESNIKDIVIPIPNGVGEDKKVNDWKNVNWNELRTAINSTLKKIPGVNEDKLLGPFFIGNKDKIEELKKDTEKFNKLFKSKVLMYLYEDVVKMNPGDLFDIQEGENIHYSDICKKFDEQGLKVFVKSVSDNVHEVKTGENN